MILIICLSNSVSYIVNMGCVIDVTKKIKMLEEIAFVISDLRVLFDEDLVGL